MAKVTDGSHDYPVDYWALFWRQKSLSHLQVCHHTPDIHRRRLGQSPEPSAQPTINYSEMAIDLVEPGKLFGQILFRRSQTEPSRPFLEFAENTAPEVQAARTLFIQREPTLMPLRISNGGHARSFHRVARLQPAI